MDALHRAYVAFTENWWLTALAASCVLALLSAPKPVPLVIAIATLALALVVTIGWMIFDLAFYPGSHNLLPFEAVFKLVLLVPLGVSVWYKIPRRQVV